MLELMFPMHENESALSTLAEIHTLLIEFVASRFEDTRVEDMAGAASRFVLIVVELMLAPSR